MPERGDIVLASFPYTDGSPSKVRPVLVLARVPGPYPDYLVAFVSSQLSQAIPGTDVLLRPADPAFAASGLKLPSVVKVGKIATLSDALIAGRIGALDVSLLDDIVGRLVAILRAEQARPAG